MPETLAAALSPALPSGPAPAPGRRPSRWLWWLLGIAALLLVLALVVQHYLDPWLRRKLEQQVTTQTHGQYRLQVGELHTSLWQRAIRLSQVRLRPAAQVADTLPRISLDAAHLNVTGVGLLALLRKSVVPVDSVVLDSARIEVLALPRKPTKNAGKPLHEQLPLHLKGLEINYLGLLHTQATYLPGSPATARFQRLDLSAHDLRISAAGAADTQRVAGATNWQLLLLQAQGQAQGHHLYLGRVSASVADRQLQVDSVRIKPTGPPQQGAPRANLNLPRLRLSGFDVAGLQRRHRFRADSLLLLQPQLTVAPGKGSKGGSPMGKLLKSVDVAHLSLQHGTLHMADQALNAMLRDIEVSGTAVHVDSTGAAGPRGVMFAQAWTLGVGRSQATVAAHALRLGGLKLSTKAGTFDLRALRIVPPAAGQGKPGAMRIDLTLPTLAVRGWEAAALQRQRHFRATSLLVAGARLNFTPPKKAPPPVWKLLGKAVRRTEVAQVRVQHSFLQIGGLRHSPEINDLNLTGRGIRIDSLAALEPIRIAYARSWRASAGLIAAPFDPPYYRATSQHASLDTDAHTFRFEGLTLKPQFSPVGMNLHKGYQVPAISARIPSVTFSGLDFAGLVRRADVRASRLTAQRPEVRINSDGRGPINPNLSQVTPEAMQKLPMVVDIRLLELVNGNLYARYRSPRTPLPGTLSINRVTATFRNFSNDPKRQTAATPMAAQASAYLQNKCRLDVQVTGNLLDPQGRHRVWGTFGSAPFGILNSMTVPTRLVQFKKGQVQRVRFDMRADRKAIAGTMWAEYTGLQMELLGYKQEEVKKTLLKRVVSKAANVIVIRDQNPRKRGELVIGKTNATREPRFSVFTLWRQGVVSGLFDNVGVPQNLAQKLSEKADEAPLPSAGSK